MINVLFSAACLYNAFLFFFVILSLAFALLLLIQCFLFHCFVFGLLIHSLFISKIGLHCALWKSSIINDHYYCYYYEEHKALSFALICLCALFVLYF